LPGDTFVVVADLNVVAIARDFVAELSVVVNSVVVVVVVVVAAAAVAVVVSVVDSNKLVICYSYFYLCIFSLHLVNESIDYYYYYYYYYYWLTRTG